MEKGVFRTGTVSISGTTYLPPADIDLRSAFEQVATTCPQIGNLFEKALVVFLFVARTKCFWDGNKRTRRLLMNSLLQSGQDIISMPAAKKQEFNEKMIGFYESAEAAEMMAFLSGCQIRGKFE